MAYRDLREFIDQLEKEGELQRIGAEVDWDLELSHISKLNDEKGGPALLFENVKGYSTPVFCSALATPKRLAVALDLPRNLSVMGVAREWMHRTMKAKIPPVEVATGPCKENIDRGDKVDLLKFPIPKY